ncbi:MAG: hypothetical protein ABW065_14040 [Solirubrobacterales bacterium]
MKRPLLGLLSLAFLLATAIPARAELVEHGDLFVRFAGGLTPTELPRERRAPIEVSVEGTVKTLSGERPPALRWISIGLNRGGVLDSRGLPVCHAGDLVSTGDSQALANCGDALVGRGSYLANTAFPEQLAFPAAGHILAFNARVGGRAAILAHIYGTEPVATTRIVTLHIHRRRGAYGTILSGALPPSLNRYGYVRRLDLSFFRRFTYRGERRSYLSAACPAPAGFPGAVFPFARASMGFADGRTLSSTLTRSCQVRR